MAGLVPAIHVSIAEWPQRKTWMPATSAGMTRGYVGTFSRTGVPSSSRILRTRSAAVTGFCSM